MSSPQNVVVIGKGVAAHARTPIERGLQLGDGNYGDGSVTYALGGRYATLSGTLYGDDAQDSTGSTFTINDSTDAARPRPLYSWAELHDRNVTRFTLDVRGVQSISLASDHSAKLDIVANLTPCPGGKTCATPTPNPTPLETLDMSSPQYVVVIPHGNVAAHARTPIERGLQLGDGNYGDGSVTYALGGRYATLSGTLYGDDAQDSTGSTFTINDTSDANNPRQLYTVTLSSDRSTTPFSVNVHGVQSITISSDHASPLDLVANLSN